MLLMKDRIHLLANSEFLKSSPLFADTLQLNFSKKSNEIFFKCLSQFLNNSKIIFKYINCLYVCIN